ncbi:MAG: hypothetical protein GEU94_14780 [Micromonosporaceae bacterium]|nr:hypothetical protein [Micromonosporaceae bacterium]
MTTTVMPTVKAREAAREAARPASVVKRDQWRQVLQAVLFIAGAVMLPLGLVVIGLGWYGAASTPYLYDQISYLVSGGLLGLGITFAGGFLYFGAWLARIAADQRESQRQLADTLLVLAEVVAQSGGKAVREDAGTVLVAAGEGTTVHRRDCQLISHRDDLRVLTGDEDLTLCRVCKPDLP